MKSEYSLHNIGPEKIKTLEQIAKIPLLALTIFK